MGYHFDVLLDLKNLTTGCAIDEGIILLINSNKMRTDE